MLPAVTPATDLPVRAVLPELLSALGSGGTAVLVAPPGTGKTTLVPLALAGATSGRVVVAEPRRVAVRAAARRMAALLGEEVGDRVGYTVRGERRIGPATRVEVVTTGVLVARLHRDPDLPGTGAVMLDECHERHLDSDLALAFTMDVRGALRPDLLLLASSATAEAGPLSQLLGTTSGASAPVVSAASALHPIEVIWAPPDRPVNPPHGLRVDPRMLDHVATTVRRALDQSEGDVLVFLPGAGEINGVAGRLGDLRERLDLVTLHGRAPAASQDAALRPGPRRRVVLATAVAESSLTVPGVRIVVDAGLSRVPRTDLGRGLDALVTVRSSRSSAEQRAGRARREAPGRVYRCWPAAEHERRPAQDEPEIAVADLTGFALQLAHWGHPDGTGLALLDPPPAAALRIAVDTLHALGAVDGEGRVTARGRSIAAVGAHPRLARALLDGAGLVGAERAAQVVAILSDDGLTGSTNDLLLAWRRLRDGADPAATARWRAEARRLRSDDNRSAASTNPGGATANPRPARANPRPATAGPGGAGNSRRAAFDAAGKGDDPLARALPDDLAAGLVVGLAYPERLARVRRPGAASYLMAGGTAAELDPGSPLAGAGWLAIAAADRAPGRSNARVRLGTAIDEATAREAGAPLLTSTDEVNWVGGELLARRVERLGALVLTERRLASPEPTLVRAALLAAVREEGLTTLGWDRDATQLRERLAFCHHTLGAPWPDVDDQALLARADEWLAPELARARRLADLRRTDLSSALRRLLPWPAAGRLDELAPDRLRVPSGSRIRVDYADPEAPVLAVKVQEAFGWAAAPVVGDGRVTVVLHLLSPAGRPVAVTRDLASFWETGYPRVRAELRGRYPRHPWPDDPTKAPATRRPSPRRS